MLLYGDLGAGKTAFVRGMARGIGANPDDVSSPTFTPRPGIRRFGRDAVSRRSLPPEGPEIDDLGLEDLVSGDGIVAIEWAERWNGRPDDVTGGAD